MKKVYVYAEGQTEETFVRDVLASYLAGRGIYLTAVLARTKRTRSGSVFKGGIVSYRQVRSDLLRLLQDTSVTLVTTMIDYYGLPQDFPGVSALRPGSPYQRVAFLESAFGRDIGHPRFLPFLTLHEFESLLFARPEEIVRAFPKTLGAEKLLQEISGLPPEEINEGQSTHPAARIARYIPNYRKSVYGPLIARRIGLHIIRHKCPHFNEWVSQLENL